MHRQTYFITYTATITNNNDDVTRLIQDRINLLSDAWIASHSRCIAAKPHCKCKWAWLGFKMMTEKCLVVLHLFSTYCRRSTTFYKACVNCNVMSGVQLNQKN